MGALANDFATGDRVVHANLRGVGGAGGLAMRTVCSRPSLSRSIHFPVGQSSDVAIGVLLRSSAAAEDGLFCMILLVASGV